MAWLKKLANAVRSGRTEREIRREMSFHLAERADELRAAGYSDDEARRRARAAFGNPAVQAERTRDADVSLALDTLLRDLRYAVRTLSRTPGFTVAVVLTLAIGIGANTAVFSALDTVLLRPLPFPDPDRLVEVRQRQDGRTETLVAPARLEDWNRLNTAFDGITGFYVDDVSDTSGDLPERLRRAFVTPRFLDVWGVAPAIGRGFSADEHRFGGPAAIIISERYWRTRLGADPNVLHRSIRLGQTAVPIVGVMPSTFHFPDKGVDLWSPSRVDAPYAQSRTATWYTATGRLRAGVTPAQARENLRAVQAGLAAQYPDTDRTISADVRPLKESAVGDAGASLWLLFAAVTVLLLIACSNIAALLLARAAQREHEIGVRISLGASRAAVAAQLLTETFVLAALGGTAGLLVAAAASRALRSAAGTLPRVDEMALDARVLVYTLVCTVAVALLCGLLPALRTAGGASRSDRRTQVSGGNGIQWMLVGAQVALSVALLGTAGLLVRSFVQLWRVDPGFETAQVLSFRISGSWGETSDYPRLRQRLETAAEALRGLPGVESVATSGWALPGVPEQWETTFEVVEARGAAGSPIAAEGRAVSPEYFATMRIPLVAGEGCRQTASTAAPAAVAEPVLVNQSFVNRYLGDRASPIGLHLRDASSTDARPPSRITGVVGDARERGLHREPGPTVYWCAIAPNPTPYFLVRTHGDPLAIAQDVRLKMKEIEPLRSVYEIAPLEERIGDAFAENRLRTGVVSLFAAAALSLSIVGLYGTLSYIVSLRRREIGLRLALGAGRRRIVSQFVRLGMTVTAAAAVLGVLLALAATRTLAGMLFGVAPWDPATFAGVLAIVFGVAGVAVLVPAARAAWLEPMRVLREQ